MHCFIQLLNRMIFVWNARFAYVEETFTFFRPMRVQIKIWIQIFFFLISDFFVPLCTQKYRRFQNFRLFLPFSDFLFLVTHTPAFWTKYYYGMLVGKQLELSISFIAKSTIAWIDCRRDNNLFNHKNYYQIVTNQHFQKEAFHIHVLRIIRLNNTKSKNQNLKMYK